MADDRVGGEMPLTHEFLALMLGVRRSGVTVAIQALERKAWVKRRRGTIAVTDRAALQQLAAGIYTVPYGQKARGSTSQG
ncbi:MAG: winged helix-turn-helix domain-containing protein [Verrucomicrobiae bacterium]|nr:winged helix-turn-helix domain-containing protein [Verrucomicrobiae bacterium]